MRIWIDIDNAPHVWIMEPIIKDLKRRGHKILITARDYGQTIDLLDLKSIPYKKIGSHPGKSKFKKIVGLTERMFSLYIWALDKKIDVAFSHGSRAQVLPAKSLGIPVAVMYDYEFIFEYIFKKFADIIIMPSLIKDEILKKQGIYKKVKKFEGLKEDLYLWNHKYNKSWHNNVEIDKNKIFVVVRPPATMAHYHNPKSETIFYRVIQKIHNKDGISILVIPRTKNQYRELEKTLSQYKNIILLNHAVDGISMLKDADIVIGGGGTMNREAALLGKRVYSIFQGKKGCVDAWLKKKGWLTFINTKEDIKKIELRKSQGVKRRERGEGIINYICNTLEKLR